MDHTKILSRAWSIVRNNRALWLFGFLLALTSGSGGGTGGGGGGGRGGPGYTFNGHDLQRLSDVDWNLVIAVVAITILVIIALGVIMAVVRYVAETALIAGVDEIERTGARLTVRRGFRLGWSKSALRLFLVNLTIGFPLVLVFAFLFAAAASPLLFWAVSVPKALRVIATLISVGLLLLVILLLIVTAIAVSIVMPYIQRRVVLARQGVIASIRQGVQLARASLMDTGLMWLMLTGIGILWSFFMAPVVIIALIITGFIGLVPGGLLYLVSKSVVAAVTVGVSLFLITFVPLISFIQGLFETYVSSAWTLAYREVVARHALAEA